MSRRFTRRTAIATLGAALAGCSGAGTPTPEEPAADEGDTTSTPTEAGEASTATATPDGASGVPTFRYSAARVGAPPTAASPAGSPTTEWTVDIPGSAAGGGSDRRDGIDPVSRSAGSQVQLSQSPTPALAESTVYAVGGDGTAVAVDTDDGSLLWRTEIGERAMASPIVAQGTVYVVAADGRVSALDTADGSERWTASVPAGDEPVTATPTMVDGALVVAGSGGRVSALDIADGDELWQTRPTEGELSSPAAVDGRLYVQSWGGTGGLYALSVDGGEQRWSASFSGGSGGSIDDTSRSSGAQRRSFTWAQQGEPNVRPAPAVADGTVYATTPAGTVRSFDEDDGDEGWSADGVRQATPAVADGTLYVSEGRDGVAALDTDDGSSTWGGSGATNVASVGWRPMQVSAPPMAVTPVGDTVVRCSGRGRVEGLAIEDGSVRWSVEFERLLTSPPTVGDETVYAVSDRNELVALASR